MPSQTPPAATAEQYRDLLSRLLPPGPIWQLARALELDGLLLAIGDELTRIHNRGRTMLDDADPSTAVELLPDWERVLGLPNPLIGTPGTVAERQAIAWATLIAKGGQNAAYYIGLAAALGITITITEPCQPFRVGHRVGAPLYSLAWAYGWIVNAPNGPIVPFRAGTRVGYRLQDARQPALEGVIGPLIPAHTIVVFRYSP